MKVLIAITLLLGCFPVAQAAVRVYDGEGTWQRADAQGTLQASYALWGYRATKHRDLRVQLRVSEEESYDFSMTIVPRGATSSAASRSVSRFDLLRASDEGQTGERVGTGTCASSSYEQTCELSFTLAGQKITLRKVFKPKRRSSTLRTRLMLSGTIAEGDDRLQWSSDLTLNLDRSVACTEQPQGCMQP